jgi:hypothetical protein
MTTTKVEALDRATAWMQSQGLHMHERMQNGRDSVERRFNSAEWCLWFRKAVRTSCSQQAPALSGCSMLSRDQKRYMLGRDGRIGRVS